MDAVARPSREFQQGLTVALPVLRRYALKLARDGDRADDLVQQTALKALASFSAFEPGSNLEAWLVTILRNHFLSEERRGWRVAEDPGDVQAATLQAPDNPLDGLELDDLRRVLPLLPAHGSETLTLLVDGLSYAEIAARLGISESTVKSRLFRLRQKLLQLLGSERQMPQQRSQTASAKRNREWRDQLQSKQGDGLRPIDPKLFARGLKPRPLDQLDPVSTLAWIKIAQLRVDGTYQRKVLDTGIRNVRRIAEQFEWCKFSPVIVAPAGETGVYAIIDGQHRTTAAAMVGVEAVPCQIVPVGRAKQAECFAAINGDVTGIQPLQMFAARVQARDPVALNLTTLCEAAGVRIRRSPTAVDQMSPGDTGAIGTLLACLRQPGPEALSAALRTIRQAAPNQRGLLGASMIRALSNLFGAEPDLRARLPEVIQHLARISLLQLIATSAAQAKERRLPAAPTLVKNLREYLHRALRKGAA